MNTTPFFAAAQALVAGNQVGTVPKTLTLQGMKTTGETFYPPALSQINKFRFFFTVSPRQRKYDNSKPKAVKKTPYRYIHIAYFEGIENMRKQN